MLFLVSCCHYEGRQLKRAVYCSSRPVTILFWEYLKISVLLRDRLSSYITDEIRAIRNEIFKVFFWKLFCSEFWSFLFNFFARTDENLLSCNLNR